MDVKKVALNVKIARVRKGITMQELSKATGMSITTISRIERAIGVPRMLSIQKLADALDVDVKELVGEN